jgi:hypothetical protein
LASFDRGTPSRTADRHGKAEGEDEGDQGEQSRLHDAAARTTLLRDEPTGPPQARETSHRT